MTRADSRRLDARLRSLASWSGAPGTVCPRLSITAMAARVGLGRCAVSKRLTRMGISLAPLPPANRTDDETRTAILMDLANGWKPDVVALMNGVSERTVANVKAEARVSGEQA